MKILVNILNQTRVLLHSLLNVTKHNHIVRETWETDEEGDLMFKRNYRIWCTCGYNWKGDK